VDYIDEDFYRRRNQVATIVHQKHLPERICHHFENLRECYSLGLFEAALIYCRAVIEVACYEWLKRKELLNDNGDYDPSLEWMMKKLKGRVAPKKWSDAYETKSISNGVMHSKKTVGGITEDFAFKSVCSTIIFVEELYG
jgi:hypothetical protein